MGKTDDADRPAAASIDTTYAVARTVQAPTRPERVPATAAPSLAMRPRSVGPQRPKPGLGEYLVVGRRRP
jgi:hypothetical protein